ncbi:MAG: T9SS type A sorting domain-containing protein [Bacteroidota bacterium]|nr:T9SS type A sorting domain-containing protein [Bacteroidota bacterium]
MRLFSLTLFTFAFIFLSFNNASSQWKQTNGPAGGQIWTMASDSANLFVGTYGGGILKSTDKGLNWRRVNVGLPDNDIQSLNFVGNKIFAGTFHYGLFMSTNKGESWVKFHKGLLEGATVMTITSDGNKIFAGLPIGVYTSTTDSANWKEINIGLKNKWITKLIKKNNYLFAATNGGVFRRGLDSTSWESFDNALSGSIVISIAATENRIFASTSYNLYVSDDNGASWKTIPGIPHEVWSIEAFDGKVYVGCYGSGVYVSNDDGESWQNITSNLKQVYINALTINSSGIFAGNNGSGVFASYDNGKSWTPARNGIIASDIVAMLTDGSDLYAGVPGMEIFKSTDNGQNWNVVSDGIATKTPSIHAFSKIDDKIIAAICDIKGYGGIYFSKDHGLNWTKMESDQLISVNIEAIAVKGNHIFVGTVDGISHTSNFGASWDTLKNGLNSHDDNSIKDLAICGNEIYAATYGGMFKSTNNGLNWIAINNGIAPKAVPLNLAVIDSCIFAGFGKDTLIYRSTDKGSSWKAVDKGIPKSGIAAFATVGKNLFAATNVLGIYLSKDLGQTWVPVNEGFEVPNVPVSPGYKPAVNALAASDKYLFAGTWEAGIFSRKLSDMIISVNNDKKTVPESYLLSQNYPNPFNPSTVINYAIPKTSKVSLRVYDLMGRQVALLVDDIKPAGKYSATFNSTLASGVYYYTLKAGEYIQSKKMIVVK